MLKLSRSQEREERRAMGRGMRRSVVSLFLCWLPVVGVLLSASGFIGICRRVTRAHRVRRTVYLILSLLILILCTGVLFTEAYVYTHDPYLFADLRDWALDTITGGEYYGSYYDDTFQNYTSQYYNNADAYTYSSDYSSQELFEGEGSM